MSDLKDLVPDERVRHLSKADAARYYPRALFFALKLLAKEIDGLPLGFRSLVDEHFDWALRNAQGAAEDPRVTAVMAFAVLRRLWCDGQVLFAPHRAQTGAMELTFAGDPHALAGALLIALHEITGGKAIGREEWEAMARESQPDRLRGNRSARESFRLAQCFGVLGASLEPVH